MCYMNLSTSSFSTFSRMRLWVILLFAVSLLHSREAKGTRETVFKQKGDDLLLNVDDVPEDHFLFDWKFNKTVALVIFPPGKKPNVSSNFTGRIELVKNFSVKLKNLQKTDSGLYTARVITPEGDQQLTEYEVTVQDPVSPVNLSVVSVVSVVSRSSASCNLTVTCSTQDSLINSTFTCVKRTCSQEGGERAEVTTSGASLQVHLLNSAIICRHSNQVSSTKAFQMIEQVCPQYAEAIHIPVTVIAICSSIGVFLIIGVQVGLVCKFLYRRKRRNYPRESKESKENTVYETPQQVAVSLQQMNQSPTDEASGPTSTYSLVGPHSGSPETRDPVLPESLYAQVEKPARSTNN